VIILGSYDLVVEMDWLENHGVVLDCKNKKIYFIDDSRHKITLMNKNRRVTLRFISTLQLNRSMRKGCKLYVVISMNEKDSMNLEHYLVLLQFLDAFPNEFPGLLPKRKLEFTIELKLGT
jgi:hypothetical protein